MFVEFQQRGPVMQYKSLSRIFGEKDTKKGRKYISQLIFPNGGQRIKPLRALCDYSATGRAKLANKDYEKRFKNKKGQTIGLKKSKLSKHSWKYVKPKGKSITKKKIRTAAGYYYNKSILKNDGGKYVNMKADNESHKIEDLLGYYPHIYYKDEWRPLFYRVVKKDILRWCKWNKKYYDDSGDFKILRLEFFCYIYRNNRANAPKDSNKRVWNVSDLLESFSERRQKGHF